MNTVKVFHEGRPVLYEGNGPESKSESCSAASQATRIQDVSILDLL